MPSINWNGKLIAQDTILLQGQDRGYLLGDGLFETLRYYPKLKNPLPCFSLHWQRLSKSAQLLQLNLPMSKEQVIEQILATITANQLHQQGARIRVTVSRGNGPSGLLPNLSAQSNLLITAEAFQPSSQPCSVFIATTRRNEQSLSAQIKSLSYLDNVLARLEAEQQGADEAILCNSKGNVASGSYHNLFAVRNDTLITPLIADGALPGITRQVILQFAHQKSLPIREQTIDSKDLYQCEEIFLTNSLQGIRTVNELNKQPIPTGNWAKIVRDYYTQWLTDEQHALC